jgi:hypothetical protein
MSRSDVPPTNKKSVKCPDCGKWVTLQGYGGHQRFYHDKYQKQLKARLFSQLLELSRTGKIDKGTLDVLIHMTGEYSDATMQELLELQDTIDILRNR